MIPATGIGMILILGIDVTARTSWWLDAAIVIYSGVYLYSFFVQRRIVEQIIELTATPPPTGAVGPPPGLAPLASRAAQGGTTMLILLVVVVFLMVVKPQL